MTTAFNDYCSFNGYIKFLGLDKSNYNSTKTQIYLSLPTSNKKNYDKAKNLRRVKSAVTQKREKIS